MSGGLSLLLMHSHTAAQQINDLEALVLLP